MFAAEFSFKEQFDQESAFVEKNNVNNLITDNNNIITPTSSHRVANTEELTLIPFSVVYKKLIRKYAELNEKQIRESTSNRQYLRIHCILLYTAAGISVL